MMNLHALDSSIFISTNIQTTGWGAPEDRFSKWALLGFFCCH